MNDKSIEELMSLSRYAELHNDMSPLIDDTDPAGIEPAPIPTNDIGRLSAEAVQSQYEAAAKAVEDMGLAVQDRIKKLENALRECDRDMKLLGEVAHTIRDKGNLVYAQIEETSSVSKDLRATAEGFRAKVTSP